MNIDINKLHDEAKATFQQYMTERRGQSHKDGNVTGKISDAMVRFALKKMAEVYEDQRILTGS